MVVNLVIHVIYSFIYYELRTEYTNIKTIENKIKSKIHGSLLIYRPWRDGRLSFPEKDITFLEQDVYTSI